MATISSGPMITPGLASTGLHNATLNKQSAETHVDSFERREETGAGRTAARQKGQSVDAGFLQMRQDQLKIENPEMQAQERLTPTQDISKTTPFFDQDFHDLLLTHITKEIGNDLDRLRGGKLAAAVDKQAHEITDFASDLFKSAVGITAGILLTPLAAFAIDAGLELLSSAAKHIRMRHSKQRAQSIIDRLDGQLNKQPDSTLNTFRTLYAYTEVILLGFYEQYGDKLQALNFDGMTDSEKNELAKSFSDAIFSSHTRKEAKKEPNRSLVDAAVEDIHKVFKRTYKKQAIDDTELVSDMTRQKALKQRSIV